MPLVSSTLVGKIKVHLKLSISRLRIVQQKDSAIAKQQRRAMASLLEQGKLESARIRVENIIRSDLITELHEILELYCELLLARIGLLEPTPCDPGLEEAVRSIIYAAPRTEIRELQQTRALLIEKFGKDFAKEAMEDRGDVKVPERVTRKLRVEPPGEELVELYLRAIAQAYDIPYGDPEDNLDEDEDSDEGGQAEEVAQNNGEDDKPGTGGTAQKNLEPPLTTGETQPPTEPATPAKGAGDTPTPSKKLPQSPVSVVPPSPSTESPNPQVKVPQNGPPKLKPTAKMKALSSNSKPIAKKKDGGTDEDDLEQRFALLKRI